MDPNAFATEEVDQTSTEQGESSAKTARELNVEDLAQLGTGLYTEATAEIDGSKDAIAFPPPLPADKYIVSLHPAKPFIVFDHYPAKTVKDRKTGEDKRLDRVDFFNLNVNFRVEEFLNDNTPDDKKALLSNRRVQRFFDQRLSSLNKEGTSEVATFMKYLGYKLNGSFKLEDLAGEVAKAILSGQGRLWAFIDWRAGWVKPSETTENGKTVKTKGHWLKVGMQNFPKNADGTYNPEIEIDGVTYKARAFVRSFGSLNAAE